MRSMIEQPCGRTQVGVSPRFAMRRSISVAHLVNKRPLRSVACDPHSSAFALKSPAMINLFVRAANDPEMSARKL